MPIYQLQDLVSLWRIDYGSTSESQTVYMLEKPNKNVNYGVEPVQMVMMHINKVYFQ